MSARTVPAAKFKEQCLALLDEVGPDGIIITKHGKPVAKLVRVRQNDGDLIGCLKGQIKVHGDILSTGRRWEAHDD